MELAHYMSKTKKNLFVSIKEYCRSIRPRRCTLGTHLIYTFTTIIFHN